MALHKEQAYNFEPSDTNRHRRKLNRERISGKLWLSIRYKSCYIFLILFSYRRCLSSNQLDIVAPSQSEPSKPECIIRQTG